MESLSSTYTISSAERRETIASEDSISQLPLDIIFEILSYLNPVELAKCGEVSRRWKRISSDPTLWKRFDLTKIFPLFSILDASDLTKCFGALSLRGLSTDDEPLIDNRTFIPILKKFSSLPVEGTSGVILLTIPKGLKFNQLVDMAREEDKVKFRHVNHSFSQEIGDTEVPKTYRVLITNNVLEGSRKLSVENQKILVKSLGCEMPKVLEASFLLVVTYMRSGQRIYNDKPWTFTRCLEELSERRGLEQLADRQMVVGGFSLSGIFVDHHYDCAQSGVGGVLRYF